MCFHRGKSSYLMNCTGQYTWVSLGSNLIIMYKYELTWLSTGPMWCGHVVQAGLHAHIHKHIFIISHVSRSDLGMTQKSWKHSQISKYFKVPYIKNGEGDC